VTALNKAVLLETEKFEALLPDLLPEHRGQWALFSDGKIASFFMSPDEAYQAAIGTFGLAGRPFVVAPVEEVKETPVTAGVLFGLR
jgi:hypothetical protein